MFVDFICTVLTAYDRVCARLGRTGPGRRRRAPLLPVLVPAAGLPHNVPLTDPQTGYRLCVQRRREFLTLVAADPAGEVGEEPATVRR